MILHFISRKFFADMVKNLLAISLIFRYSPFCKLLINIEDISLARNQRRTIYIYYKSNISEYIEISLWMKK